MNRSERKGRRWLLLFKKYCRKIWHKRNDMPRYIIHTNKKKELKVKLFAYLYAITGLLLMYVSRDVTSTTEFFLISSGDKILNWTPIIFEAFLYSVIVISVVGIVILYYYNLYF